MAGINDYECEGVITIGSTLMSRLAWTIQADEGGQGGLFPLLTTASQRGSDRLLPGATGVLPFRRRTTVTPHRLRVVVAADVQPNGTASVIDADAQLVVNLKAIYDGIIVPTGTGDGTRAITVVLPGGLTGTGFVHVTSLTLLRYGLGENSAIAEGMIDISIPAGRLTWA